jgi:hypothetical protein
MNQTVFGKLLFKRGAESAMPALDPGEPFFAEDTGNLWIGAASGNVLVGEAAVVAELLAAHLADLVAAHPAEAISFNASTTFAPGNVQAGLAELDADKASKAEALKNALLGL